MNNIYIRFGNKPIHATLLKHTLENEKHEEQIL